MEWGSESSAVGGGKTCCISNEVIAFASQYNADIIFGRSEYTDFRTTTEVELERWFPPGLIQKWNRSYNEITLRKNPNAINAKDRIINGKRYIGRQRPTMIYLRALANPEKLKSYNLGMVGVDEASGIPFESFIMLASRLREPSMFYMEYEFIMGTNPCAGWLKENFINLPDSPEDRSCEYTPDPYNVSKTKHCSKCESPCKQGKGFSFIPSFIKDNTYLPENYYDLLTSIYPEEYVKMLLDGDWNAVSGLLFPEMSNKALYCEPFQIPPDWTKYFCMDPHAKTPTHALWVAVSPNGIIYVYRELIVKDTIANISKTILNLEVGEQIFCRLIDTSANSDDYLTGLNVRSEFAKHGVSCSNCSKGNAIGYNRIKEVLSKNRIQIFNNCTVFKKQMENMVWDTYGSKLSAMHQEEKQMWVKKDDHLFDCLKYILILDPKYVHLSRYATEMYMLQNGLLDEMSKGYLS